MRRAVYLDRDGTINAMVYNEDCGAVDSPSHPDEFELLPGVGEGIRLINEMGLLAIVVSNQPGIAKGKFPMERLEAMTRKMHVELAKWGASVDRVYYCLHHPEAILHGYRVVCECRKPKPGLLVKGGWDFGIDLAGSYVVGDSLKDVLAGKSVGCETFWIGSPGRRRGEGTEDKGIAPDFVVADLLEAARIIRRKESEDGDLRRFG